MGERNDERESRSCGRQMVTSRFVDNRFSEFSVHSKRRTVSPSACFAALTDPSLITPNVFFQRNPLVLYFLYL